VIKKLLEDIGKFILDNNMRCGFHPGHHLVLNSENDNVVINSIIEFDKHSQIMDLMQLPQNTYYYVNVHLNSSKPNLEESSLRFCNNFKLLSDSSKKRITVENDDKQALYTIQDLHRLIHLKTGIPIVADSLHWKCHNDDFSWEDSLKLATSTWGIIKPLCHHSNSRKLYEDNTATLQSHTDYFYEKFEDCGLDVDVELECKMKDIALFKYKRDYIIS
jgi:UV DNA damage endonuclease